MKHMFKKSIFVMLAGAMMGTLLTACGSTSSSEDSTSLDASLPDQYKTIVEEYQSAISDPEGEYADVASGSYFDIMNEDTIPGKFYYALYDLNKDGKDELVIGIAYDGEEDIENSIIGLFTQGDEKAQSLLAVEQLDATAAFAYEIPVTIAGNDNTYLIDMDSCDDGLKEYKIADDGITPEKVADFTTSVDDDDNLLISTSDGKTVNYDEFINSLGGTYYDFDWHQIKAAK